MQPGDDTGQMGGVCRGGWSIESCSVACAVKLADPLCFGDFGDLDDRQIRVRMDRELIMAGVG
jgi:hypothetical protein